MSGVGREDITCPVGRGILLGATLLVPSLALAAPALLSAVSACAAAELTTGQTACTGKNNYNDELEKYHICDTSLCMEMAHVRLLLSNLDMTVRNYNGSV